jgi:putative ABC transport system permease protein
MIRMIFKISLRNMMKHRVYSLINILGLTLGFTAFILITLFVRYELNWDKSNTEYDNIYRIQRHYSKTMYAMDGNDISPHSRAITAQLIEKQYAEIRKATVTRSLGSKFIAADPARQISNTYGICADSCYFDVFTYRFIEGTQVRSLDEPFSVVLSKTMANRLFGGKKALGESVVLENKYALNVTGVFEDPPENTSIKPDYIVSFSSLAKLGDIKRSDLYSGDCLTFVLLNKGANYKQLEAKIKNTFAGFKGVEFEELQLCPMNKLYLNPNGRNDYIIALMLFGLIGIFILVMSAFNYINLTTANASVRGKEVAIKKAVGSSRYLLIMQFLGETVITSLISMLLAFQLASAFLPVFSGIVYKQLSFSLATDAPYILLMILIALITGILSGIYPAMVLTSKDIISLFRNRMESRGAARFSLKNILVSLQFAISLFLILITISFSLQIRYLYSKNLGFDKEHILYTRMNTSDRQITFDQLRGRLMQNNDITDAMMCKHIPFVTFGGGMTNWEGGDPNEKISCRFNTVSYDFVKTLGIHVVAGRDFSRDFPGDIGKACLINETAARCFGWNDPIGRKLNDNRLTVVGVLANYSYKDMHNGIEPGILVLAPDKTEGEWTFAFKCRPGTETRTKALLTSEFTKIFPNDPFEFNDLPTAFSSENTFKVYHSVNRTIVFFTFFNIFLAIIGLLGLVSFTTVRRTKEIGVRKINGCSGFSIFFLLSRDYYIMMILAMVIAFPSGWWVYEQIPGANKLHASAWVFLLDAMIIFVIILLTTGWQTFRAAMRNPVEALRYE